MTNEKPPLGPGPSDHLSSFIRMGTGSVPFVGAALNELVTQVIPGVRIQRIEDYLRYLDQKLAGLSEEEAKTRLQSRIALDVFEEGALLSIRALTVERQEQISTAVANGLLGDESELIEAKRVLQLLRELDDAQVIVLASKLLKFGGDSDFRDKHKNVLEPEMRHMGSSREEIDRGIVKDIADQRLLSLGLIRHRFKPVKKGELPEFDPKTGMMKTSGTEITPLGKLLLRKIGLANEDDF